MRNLFVCLLLAGAAGAQVYTDAFNYPDGTLVPGWTEKRGDWIVSAGRVHSQTASTWSYLTKDGYVLKDCVTEANIFYEGVNPVIQFGGTDCRHLGGANDSNIVMCKIQDNGGAADFDRFFTYERVVGAAAFTDIVPGTRAARARFKVSGNLCITQVDADQNGIWDFTHTKTLTTNLLPGELGVNAFYFTPLTRSSGVDDFALFDAVLNTTGTPNVGATVTLNLQGQNAGRNYQVACSLSNSPGIAVDTRNIPLTPDAFMLLSLSLPAVFANFAGVLDANAQGQAQVLIPAVPALAGFSFYAGFVVVNPAAPSGIENISNDERITIVP
jgi:hypothetical protein